MFQKIAKHRANDASNDVHRPPLAHLGRRHLQTGQEGELPSDPQVHGPLIKINPNRKLHLWNSIWIQMGKSESNASSQTKRRLLHLHQPQTGRRIQVTSHSQRSLSSLDGWMKTIDFSITKICIVIINTVIATIITFSITTLPYNVSAIHWASSELVPQVRHEVQDDLSQRIQAHQVRLRELQKETTTHFR